MLQLIEDKLMQQNGNAVKYLTVQGIDTATDNTIKKINTQISSDFGLAGPLTLSTPSERVHAVRWAVARESFVVETFVKRVNKEIVATCVAQLNQCPYCEDAHGASIMSSGDIQTANMLTSGTWKNLKDEKTKQLIDWSLHTRTPNATIVKNPPFSREEAPEIIGTALVFHSTNRLVNIFLEASPLPNFLTGNRIKKTALKIAAKTLFKSMITNSAKAGESLQFIQNYSVSKTLAWPESIPAFAKALAAERVVLKEIEEEIIPLPLVQLFKNHVNKWQGEAKPLGRTWLNYILKDVNESDRHVGRLLFLAAFAPYAITEDDIGNFRKVKPTDTALLEACFWAIQTLTNKIGEWLIHPFINS
ncbi:MAG TPA: hypothetical protein ENK46_10945 [Flavobacteriia bacterium]|nr:hypothetical protein [Flavobacteriia bacterium]